MALDALTNAAARYSPGAIIVQGSYAPDSRLRGIAVMYRVRGYNPDHDDWWWMERRADGTVEAEGRPDECIACHGETGDGDDIVTQERVPAGGDGR